MTSGLPGYEAAIRSRGLTKSFGDQTAVQSVDLEVPKGAVYGFVGPNGSGKTTTIRMLLDLIRASGGEHELLGLPMPARSGEVLGRVGSLVEGPAFHPYLSGHANLTRLDAADRLSDPRTAKRRVSAALDRVGLLAAGRKPYRAYSLGMRQRLAIAAALREPRELLVLDEPTNGLDPQGTREVRSLVASLATAGATVLISSHLLSEVQQICTHLGVMRAGKLVAQGPLAEIRAQGDTRVSVETDRVEDAARVLRSLGVTEVRLDGGRVQGVLNDVVVARIVPALVENQVPVLGFGVAAQSLEDRFVELTGEGFDVSG
ncbi:ATP-binding cassette domain-containing protein [Saxibacter everestensis]|uniref:ATP-binding cassette domain-containing protein n=1 Tax=Saxibacter everestensis TaxID=2909229 RepID=A0ABY8QTI0_9MICO|nr:ATP-binding cassette domain-containing protein [Brevibacteriaceae bacterium ZFBP1038]